MPAPLAKGLIIAASVIVAAGIAIYESPQVREWADQTRRKIALALHHLGDDFQPRRLSESSDDLEARRRRREELIRRNRNELIRRAREEGISVDLDELAKIGAETAEVAARRSQADRLKTFDHMISGDGRLREEAKTTGTDFSTGEARIRGTTGFATGSATAAMLINPFDDNATLPDTVGHTETLSNNSLASEKPDTHEGSANVQTDAISNPSTGTLVNLAPVPERPSKENSLSPAQSQLNNADQTTQSFLSLNLDDAQVVSTSAADTSLPHPFSNDDSAEQLSVGTLTPRSERSMTMATASEASDIPDDVGVLGMQNDTHHDARSEIFSEGGFTDAFSEGGFSEFEAEGRAGIMTPSSWSHVGSDDESEWGRAAGENGYLNYPRQ